MSEDDGLFILGHINLPWFIKLRNLIHLQMFDYNPNPLYFQNSIAVFLLNPFSFVYNKHSFVHLYGINYSNFIQKYVQLYSFTYINQTRRDFKQKYFPHRKHPKIYYTLDQSGPVAINLMIDK